jgi:hypothetical protein
MNCPRCQFDCPPDFAFCPGCGAKISAARPAAVKPALQTPATSPITHDTYRLVRENLDVQPQPPLSVKGHAEPVQTYLVLSAPPRAFRTTARGVEGIEVRMIGRDAELA